MQPAGAGRPGDRQALETLLARCQPDLRAFVEIRLGHRLAACLDPSDVVQEAQLEVVRRMDDFLRLDPLTELRRSLRASRPYFQPVRQRLQSLIAKCHPRP